MLFRSGFTYNIGRLVAAVGAFLVGAIASRGSGALDGAITTLIFVGFVPLAGLAILPWAIETRGRALPE